MTARRRIDTAVQTPGLDFLRSVLADARASRADKLKAALALAPVEKAACTRTLEPGARRSAAEAATDAASGTEWEGLLTPPQ